MGALQSSGPVLYRPASAGSRAPSLAVREIGPAAAPKPCLLARSGLPVVLTRAEVRAVIQKLQGTPRQMALLMYGAGFRLLECARLRVQDVDFASKCSALCSWVGANGLTSQ